jgi:hypothetical protein
VVRSIGLLIASFNLYANDSPDNVVVEHASCSVSDGLPLSPSNGESAECQA